MKIFYLHGKARKLFGGPFVLDVETPIQGIRFLIQMIPGFEAFLKKHKWKVIRGPKATGVHCDVDRLKTTLGKIKEVHLAIVPTGSKKQGIGKVILGAIIIVVAVAAAVFTGGGSLAAGATAAGGLFGTGISFGAVAVFGASMILSGVAQMLASTPTAGNANDRETDKASFIFNGPVNVVQEGQPIPLAYGKRIMVGSVVASAGIFSEDVTG